MPVPPRLAYNSNSEKGQGLKDPDYDDPLKRPDSPTDGVHLVDSDEEEPHHYEDVCVSPSTRVPSLLIQSSALAASKIAATQGTLCQAKGQNEEDEQTPETRQSTAFTWG